MFIFSPFIRDGLNIECTCLANRLLANLMTNHATHNGTANGACSATTGQDGPTNSPGTGADRRAFVT
jgi:hypothetical protein